MDLDEELKGNQFYQFFKIKLADETYREYRAQFDAYIVKLDKITRFMPRKMRESIWGAVSMANLLEYHTTVLACEHMELLEDPLPLAECLRKDKEKV